MVTSGSTYFLSNKKAATVCDLSGEDQKSIIGFPKQGSDNQKWKVQNTGNGWTFQNALDGKYLDIEGKVENGSKVVAVQTDSPRVWDIRPDQNDNDACRIFLQGTALNLDLSKHGDSASATPVQIWNQWEPGENQVWRFEQA